LEGTGMSQMVYTEAVNKIFTLLEKQDKQLTKMAHQINEMYHDFEPTDDDDSKVQYDYDEATIKKEGQKIAYNLIEAPNDVVEFRKFIHRAKASHKQLTTEELQYVDYADKNFDDIRLSRKHLGILQGVYFKLYKESWPFQTVMGYMYKLDNNMIWEWFR
jgi:septal ring factor EnvC (AmiA/AmiB activator)